jgi:hypothetical protein
MVQSLENIDKSKVYAGRITGLDEVVEGIIDDTLTGAVSTITTSDLTAGKVLVSDNNGKVAAGSDALSDLVHKTGDETIGGMKTFTSRTTLKTSGGAEFYIDDTRYGFVRPTTITNGKRFGICGTNTVNGSIVYNGLNFDIYSDGSKNISMEYSPATSDNSNQIATTAFVKAQGYATDSDVVHTSGNETISGIKTFANSNNPQITIKNTQYAYSDTQSSNQYWGIQFNDKNNVRVAKIEPYFIGSGAVGINLSCSTQVSGSLKYGALAVSLDASGNPTTQAITPATADNSTKIATTAFVKAQGYITSALKLPNYSSASNKSVGTQYTAANNCMVICNGTISTNGDRQTAISYFYINGAKYLKAEHFNVYGNGSAPFSFTVILQKGQTYKMAAEAYNCTAYKYVEIPLTA